MQSTGTLLDAGLVLEVDTGLRDHVRHGGHTMRAMDAPERRAGSVIRGSVRGSSCGTGSSAPDPLTGATLTDAVGELVADDDGILVVRTRRGDVRVPRDSGHRRSRRSRPSPSRRGKPPPGPVGRGPPAGHGRRLAGDGDGPAGRLGAARVARVHPAGQLGDDRRQPRHPGSGRPRRRRALVCRARPAGEPHPGRAGRVRPGRRRRRRRGAAPRLPRPRPHPDPHRPHPTRCEIPTGEPPKGLGRGYLARSRGGG